MAAGAGGIRAGKAFVEVGVDDKIPEGLRKCQSELKAFSSMAKQFSAPFLAAGGAVTAFGLASAKVFAAMGDTLNDMSARTGVSVEALSELGNVASVSGTDLATVEGALRKLARTSTAAAGGSQEATRAIEALGVPAKALVGLGLESQLGVIADAMQNIKDPSARAAAAMGVFGRGGTAIIPMLSDGAAGLANMRTEMRRLGLTITTDGARRASELDDSLVVLNQSAKMVAFQFGAALAPALTRYSKELTVSLSKLIRHVEINSDFYASAVRNAAAVATFGLGLRALGTSAEFAASGLGAVSSVIKAISGASALKLFGSVAAGIGGVALAGSVWYASTVKSNANLSTAAEDAAAANAEAIKNEQARIEILKALSGRQALTATEMLTADRIISDLTKKYGSLNITLDATANKLTVAAGAFDKIGAAQASTSAEDRIRKILELMENVEVLDKMVKARGGEGPLLRWMQDNVNAIGGNDTYEGLIKRRSEQLEKLRKLTDWKGAGGTPAGSAASPIPMVDPEEIARIAKLEEESSRRVQSSKIALISDEHLRRIATINSVYDEEIKRNGENSAIIANLEKARKNELLAAERDHNKKILAERTKLQQQLKDAEAALSGDTFKQAADAVNNELNPAIAKAMKAGDMDKAMDLSRLRALRLKKIFDDQQEPRRAGNEDLKAEIARLKIANDPTLTDAQKKLKNLAIDFQKELKDATAAGFDPKLVEAKYRELATGIVNGMDLADASSAVMGTTSAFGVAGMFGGERAANLGASGVAERTAKAGEDSKKLLREIRDDLRGVLTWS